MMDVLKKVEGVEKKVLSHEPVPGYRTAFYVIFILSTVYLGIVFFSSIP